ncbi:MAG TPA: peptidase MA family metallohydrolase [Myxococcota bacterium]|nr:peptidase MA family metallohydrolase [Myxococcota bacterium]HRY95073.1 peptidase MA family metallohydrolase [Myxococcota bacterium]HSA23758.1 peptidase MA family metallohydrolase [Myxococcota bacterium]
MRSLTRILCALLLLLATAPAVLAAARGETRRGELWVTFPAGRERAGQAFLEQAERDLVRLGRELGQGPGAIEIGLAEDFAEMKRLAPPGRAPPSWAAGLAFPRERLLLLRLDARVEGLDGLERILSHELAHLCLARATRLRPLPRWFHEGFAVYAAGEFSFGRAATLAHAALSGRLFSLEALVDSFPEDPAQAELAYAESIDFVGYLLGTQGRPAFQRLIGLLGEGWALPDALEEAYDASLAGLERRWRTDLERRATWIPLLTGAGAVWALVAALMGAVFLRRRRARRLALLMRGAGAEPADDEPPPPLSPWSP